MKILITGVAGFIGFHVAKELFKNKKFKVHGIDNFDKYYSVKLKKENTIIEKNKKFIFNKIDITSKKINSFFKKNNLISLYILQHRLV